MFGLKHFKLVKELTNKKPQTDWLKFSNSKTSNSNHSSYVTSVISDSGFVEEDLKIRLMVEEMLEKEFSSDIKKMKSYSFLVDSVVSKLKQKQLGNISSLEDIK